MHNLIKNWNCQIAENKKRYFIASIAIILVGLVVVAIFGFNIGIDFSGGTVLSVTAGDYITDDNFDKMEAEIISVLTENGVKVEVSQSIVQDGQSGIQVRYKNQINGSDLSDTEMFSKNEEIEGLLYSEVKGLIKAENPSADDSTINTKTQIAMSTVGASASAALILNAFISVLAAAALILLYVAIRFELWSGLSAVIALTHDILVMIAFVAILRIQINASFVAALITIVGYSINNTIVLFDRLRENKGKYSLKDASPTKLVNISIKDTMSRSILTTLTTLCTITILAIIGVPQIREFAIPIIIGLVAGTYSSIFIAPPLWGVFQDRKNSKIKKVQYK